MKVQPIANYEQRMKAYREEVRHFVLFECSWMFAMCLAMSLGMSYLIAFHSPDGVPAHRLPVSTGGWSVS